MPLILPPPPPPPHTHTHKSIYWVHFWPIVTPVILHIIANFPVLYLDMPNVNCMNEKTKSHVRVSHFMHSFACSCWQGNIYKYMISTKILVWSTNSIEIVLIPPPPPPPPKKKKKKILLSSTNFYHTTCFKCDLFGVCSGFFKLVKWMHYSPPIKSTNHNTSRGRLQTSCPP